MRKLKRRLRAQPRSKTPPVSFRGEASGERTVLMLDESFTTAEQVTSSSRQPIFLKLGAGVTVTLASRKVNKRRYPQLRIQIAARVPETSEPIIPFP
jgi:hypothetical protein